MSCLALRGHGEFARDTQNIKDLGKSKDNYASHYRVQPHYDIGHALDMVAGSSLLTSFQ
jgi:hypothetical protein